MLYDPKWEVPVKADPFSLDSLIAWLEKQPPGKTYDYSDCGGLCLICQHLTAHDIHFSKYAQFENSEIRLAVAAQIPFTFGAALERARAAHC